MSNADGAVELLTPTDTVGRPQMVEPAESF